MLGRLKGGMSQQSAPQQYTGDNKEGFEYWLKYSGDLTKGVLKKPQTSQANVEADPKSNMYAIVNDTIKMIDKTHNGIKKVLLNLKRSAREFEETPEDLKIAGMFCEEARKKYMNLGADFSEMLLKVHKESLWSEKWRLRQEEVKAQPKRPQTCRYFRKRGGCKYGENCKFSHEMRSASHARSDRSGYTAKSALDKSHLTATSMERLNQLEMETNAKLGEVQ